jgi:hypothetical protein
MTDVSQSNRRIHSRRSARLPARLGNGTDSVEGIVENIGEGGVFFATENLELNVEEGAAVTVSFECVRPDGAERVERTGSILRMERYFDGEHVVRAFAIRFDESIALDGVALS